MKPSPFTGDSARQWFAERTGAHIPRSPFAAQPMKRLSFPRPIVVREPEPALPLAYCTVWEMV